MKKVTRVGLFAVTVVASVAALVVRADSKEPKPVLKGEEEIKKYLATLDPPKGVKLQPAPQGDIDFSKLKPVPLLPMDDRQQEPPPEAEVILDFDFIPQDTAPGNTALGNAVPGNAVPGNTVPGNTVPGNTALGNTALGNTAPDNTAPSSTAP